MLFLPWPFSILKCRTVALFLFSETLLLFFLTPRTTDRNQRLEACAWIVSSLVFNNLHWIAFPSLHVLSFTSQEKVYKVEIPLHGQKVLGRRLYVD